jgi:hypothetical protein
MARYYWAAAIALGASVAALATSPAAIAQEGEGAAPSIATPAAPLVFDSQVAFSPTYSSGYYYASPYAGYTSLSYYANIYTSRRFGG